MTEFGEMLDRITVSVRSPDRSMSIVATFDGRMTVELAPGALRRHSEETLARQLAATIRVGITAMQRGYDEAVRRTDIADGQS